MKESLKSVISAIVPLSENEYSLIEGITRERAIKKKDILVREGESCNTICFYNEGCFRFFYTDESGREITSDFSFGPGFITSYTSFLTGQKSHINVQSMYDTNLLEIEKGRLYNLYENYHHIERIGRLMAERTLIDYEKHLFMILNQPAEFRYKILLENNPKYIREIPLQYIASYLGITQETLSRIRRLV
jgi:CRP-like cAMP-binding protein